MSFLVWLLLAGGGFLIYAGFTGKGAFTVLRDTLQGK